MKQSVKLLIGLLLVGAGVGLYLYLTRKRTAVDPTAEALKVSEHTWAVSDMLQGTQISALAHAVEKSVSRDEVTAMVSAPAMTTNAQLEHLQAQVTQLTGWAAALQSGQGVVFEPFDYAQYYENSIQ